MGQDAGLSPYPKLPEGAEVNSTEYFEWLSACEAWSTERRRSEHDARSHEEEREHSEWLEEERDTLHQHVHWLKYALEDALVPLETLQHFERHFDRWWFLDARARAARRVARAEMVVPQWWSEDREFVLRSWPSSVIEEAIESGHQALGKTRDVDEPDEEDEDANAED